MRAEMRRCKSHGEPNIMIQHGKIITTNPRSIFNTATFDVNANTHMQNWLSGAGHQNINIMLKIFKEFCLHYFCNW